MSRSQIQRSNRCVVTIQKYIIPSCLKRYLQIFKYIERYYSRKNYETDCYHIFTCLHLTYFALDCFEIVMIFVTRRRTGIFRPKRSTCVMEFITETPCQSSWYRPMIIIMCIMQITDAIPPVFALSAIKICCIRSECL